MNPVSCKWVTQRWEGGMWGGGGGGGYLAIPGDKPCFHDNKEKCKGRWITSIWWCPPWLHCCCVCCVCPEFVWTWLASCVHSSWPIIQVYFLSKNLYPPSLLRSHGNKVSGSEMECTNDGVSESDSWASSDGPRGQGAGGVGMCARIQYVEYRCSAMHSHLFWSPPFPRLPPSPSPCFCL